MASFVTTFRYDTPVCRGWSISHCH